MSPGPKTAKVARYTLMAIFALPVLFIATLRTIVNAFEDFVAWLEQSILTLTRPMGEKLAKWEDNCPERLMEILREQGEDE